MTTQKSKIILKGLKLDLFLGWTQEERSQKQAVLVDIILRFIESPKACKTDNLADTICYYSLIKEIENKTITQEFKLLESLAAHIYQIIQTFTLNQAFASISITKQPSSLPELTGGAVFKYGDNN